MGNRGRSLALHDHSRCAYRYLFLVAVFLLVAIFLIAERFNAPKCEDSHIVVEKQTSDCAYLFLLSSQSYFPCLSVVIYSLKQTQTTKDIVVLVTQHLTNDAIITALEDLGAIVVKIDPVSNPNSHVQRKHLRDNYTKLKAWQLTGYDKIVYTDADFLYVRNSDDLCYLPAAVNAGRNFMSTRGGEWPDETFFNAGFMVIDPSVKSYCSLLASSKVFVSPTGGDQPFQNWYWKGNWTELDYKYDGVNANVYYQRREEWEPEKVRSMHFTRFTNPCNKQNQHKIDSKWFDFEVNGLSPPSEVDPMSVWYATMRNLIEERPHFWEIFQQVGFMSGYADTGEATNNPRKEYLDGF